MNGLNGGFFKIAANFGGMNNLEDVLKKLRTLKHSLQKRYGIHSLAVFGSFSRHEQSPESDLDLLVEFDSPIGLEFVDLAEELEAKLGIRVDLVSRKGVKPNYLKAIIPELVYV